MSCYWKLAKDNKMVTNHNALKLAFRLVKANQKVEIDPDAAEKLVVVRADFLHALANDVKPAFGASEEVLQVRKYTVFVFLI